MSLGPPSRDEINQMSKLIALMNAGVSDEPDDIVMENYKTIDPSAGDAIRAATSDKQSMKEILERMYSANDVVIDKAKTNRVLKEAIDTHTIENGVMIGHYSIISSDNHYDVVDTSTGKKIAEDLSLYDAAYGIAKFLYEGAMINDHRIKTILIQESDYSKYINDAALYKINMKTSDDRKRMVLEDRYQVAYDRAKGSRKIIKDLLKD
jgi:hypothetical protein